jgi:hypothetical protein
MVIDLFPQIIITHVKVSFFDIPYKLIFDLYDIWIIGLEIYRFYSFLFFLWLFLRPFLWHNLLVLLVLDFRVIAIFKFKEGFFPLLCCASSTLLHLIDARTCLLLWLPVIGFVLRIRWFIVALFI